MPHHHGAQGGLAFLAPRFSPAVHSVLRIVSPAYLRLGEGISAVKTGNADALVREFDEFFAGRSRLIIAFRHPSVSDAPLLAYLFSRGLPRIAQRLGRRLPARSHVHFLYGRGVPVWAGAALGWILPRIAAIPVYNRRHDSRGMAAVRRTAVDGRFPLALAPEGQVSYHNKAVGELEAGTGRIALWCRDDLRAAGRSEDVRILPLSIEYRYPGEGRPALAGIIREISKRTGMKLDVDPADPGARVHESLLDFTGRLLSHIESAYRVSFRAPSGGGATAGATAGATEGPQAADPAAGPVAAPEPAAGASHPSPDALRRRILALCDRILRVGENVHGLAADGSLLDRVFRLRDAGWRRMFRDDLEALSPLERSLADAAAEEARIAAHHMELVDVLEYLDPAYISPEGPFERLVEYAVNLQDVVNRLLGGTIAGRMRIKGREAVVRAGRPVSVEEFAADGPDTGASDPRGTRVRQPGTREAASRITTYIGAEFARLMRGAE
ncbi:MAG: hypothetical protein ACLFPO_06335 [Spirochaetaceae bacterium]